MDRGGGSLGPCTWYLTIFLLIHLMECDQPEAYVGMSDRTIQRPEPIVKATVSAFAEPEYHVRTNRYPLS